MVEACGIHGKNRNACRIVMEKLEGERPLGKHGHIRE